MNKSVAIDGPAGAGKSTLARQLAQGHFATRNSHTNYFIDVTEQQSCLREAEAVARQLAQRLGFMYVDTGAIYRTVALYTMRRDIPPEEVVPELAGLDIQVEYDGQGVQRMRLNGEDVSEAIRALEHSVVMDGRDIGTVVLPHADVKIFLTASPEVRARRRLLELEQRGQSARYEQILQDIRDRDRQDQCRSIAPLRQAEDAVLLDTSGLDLEQSLAAMLEIVHGRQDT